MILTSCIKDDHRFTPRANYVPSGNAGNVIDTLKGKEFRFDSLIWYRSEFDQVSISIVSRPDLFTYPRDVEVSLMPDSASDWVPVCKSPAERPYYGFLFGFGNDGRLIIFSYPADVSLEDKVASVKVRF